MTGAGTQSEPPVSGPAFDRFTERAKQVVCLAFDEAKDLKHHYIGTEHLLLGLIVEEDGLASRVLQKLGLARDGVRDAVAQLVGEGDEAPTGEIPFTPRTKKVLDLAKREALALQHNYIGTEHILLGMVREDEGVAAKIMRDQGITPDVVRGAIVDLLVGTPRRPRSTAMPTVYNQLAIVSGPDDPFSASEGVHLNPQDGRVRVTVRGNGHHRVVLDGTFYVEMDAEVARHIAACVEVAR